MAVKRLKIHREGYKIIVAVFIMLVLINALALTIWPGTAHSSLSAPGRIPGFFLLYSLVFQNPGAEA